MPTDLLASARSLLESNTQEARKDGRTYRFSVPSPRAYPFQWFWDSCFHAIVWTYFDLERAKDELRSLVASQRHDGLIPHVIFWNRALAQRSPRSWHQRQSSALPWTRPRATARIQPPVLAQAVERVVARDGRDGFLPEILPAVKRYYRYLARTRDPDGDGLLSLIASFESGLDFSPIYDPPGGIDRLDEEFTVEPRWLRRRERVNKTLGNRVARVARRARHHQEDVLLNTTYVQGLEALGRLARLAADDTLAEWADAEAAKVTEALLGKCFDSERGLFFNLAGTGEEPVRIKTIVSLLPLALERLPSEVAERLVEHLLDPDEFWLRYPVPSVARSERAFHPGRTWLIWRGPLSMNTNWFLVHGLRLHGRADVAGEIAERSRALVAEHGFNEFYNPLSGEPVGVETFGWATLVVDM